MALDVERGRGVRGGADSENLYDASFIQRFPVLFRGSDDEGDLGLFCGNVGGHADPEVVALVAFGGGDDDGGAVHVGGDDGAGLLGGEAGFIDDLASKTRTTV